MDAGVGILFIIGFIIFLLWDFGVFGKNSESAKNNEALNKDSIDWHFISSVISLTLEQLLVKSPESIVSDPFARVVLTDESKVYFDFGEPNKINPLKGDDLCMVFLKENKKAYNDFASELVNSKSPFFQKIAIEQFSKELTLILKKRFEDLIDGMS